MNKKSSNSAAGLVAQAKLRAANAMLKSMQAKLEEEKENDESENKMLRATLRHRLMEVKTTQRKREISEALLEQSVTPKVSTLHSLWTAPVLCNGTSMQSAARSEKSFDA